MYSVFKRFGDMLPAMATLCLLLVVSLPGIADASEGEAIRSKNRLRAISLEEGASPSVLIRTEKPVGYRYTIYDSFDPIRVVIDFPGLDVAGVAAQLPTSVSHVQDIKVSSFDLASGQLGRIELFLTTRTGYKVHLAEQDFRVSFVSSPASATATPATAVIPAAEAVAEAQASTEMPVAAAEPKMVPSSVVSPTRPAQIATSPATLVKDVQVNGGRVVMQLDGNLENIQYFTLGAPPRLVVDLFGVKPSFKERSFPAAQGFKQMRVGSYADKTRFVFDAEGVRLPSHTVDKQGSVVVVGWGAVEPSALPPLVTGVPVTVEAVDFNSENGKSVVSILLSADAKAIAPQIDGNMIRFGVQNAGISKALRRSVDASAFPSSIRMITPYTVQEGRRQNVLFAVELKGPVPYDIRVDGRKIQLLVDNGPFAEKPAIREKVQKPVVPVSANAPVASSVAVPVSASAPGKAAATAKPAHEDTADNRSLAGKKTFRGQRISLVFDDADIRMILKLIGEVSETNIIAGDDVKGTITLRLIDVPWDQALDLLMEIKELGQLREGNVVRILPYEKIRAMRQAELTSVRDERQLEPLITEVISVSYTSLANIAAPVKDLLTKDRGKVTEDNRNKQLIVTDVPAVIHEVRRLVGILDTPERQVMIEARIVEASSTFGRDLGVKWGLSYRDDTGGAGDPSRANLGLGGGFLIAPPTAGNVMGSAGMGSGITFGRVGIDSTVLDLRISALETSGYGKVVSTPRISTINGGQATISQGTKIPYQSSGADGLPKTEFIDANLQLTVTPVINPDNSIILDISATNSSIGSTVNTGGGTAPAIDTKETKTKLLVRDGETTVIGGIFVETENFGEAGVPLLRSIPILGHLFKSTNRSTSKAELLVFITPRIVN
jgi:type IV pilus assembly protein PilQ